MTAGLLIFKRNNELVVEVLTSSAAMFLGLFVCVCFAFETRQFCVESWYKYCSFATADRNCGSYVANSFQLSSYWQKTMLVFQSFPKAGQYNRDSKQECYSAQSTT